MQLGDLLINEGDGRPPLKLLKAMAVIADYLHPTFDVYYTDHQSRDSCILVSEVLRDFLFRVGFHDVEVRSVAFYIERRKADQVVHAAMVGKPGVPDNNGRWNGHMVVVLPKTGWLIDATLYQTQRRHWEQLPGMMATPVYTDVVKDGRNVVGGFVSKVDDELLWAMWLDTPENKRWRTAPDLLKGGRREQIRRAVAARLIDRFQQTKDEALT